MPRKVNKEIKRVKQSDIHQGDILDPTTWTWYIFIFKNSAKVELESINQYHFFHMRDKHEEERKKENKQLEIKLKTTKN